MSASSGDELNLRHFHCSIDSLSLHDHSDVRNRRTAPAAPRPPAQQGHRQPLSTRCTTNDGHVNNLVQELHHPTTQQLPNLHNFQHVSICCIPSQTMNRNCGTSTVFQHRVPVLDEGLLCKTLESPSWESTLKTTGGTATGTSAALYKNCAAPRATPRQPRALQQPCPRRARRS